MISSDNHGGRRYAPFAFTEQGVAMLATILNSKKAVNVNISIMRAFVKLRYYVISQSVTNEQFVELRKMLMLHIENTDFRLSGHDAAIQQIIHALNNLIEHPKEPKRIGFGT